MAGPLASKHLRQLLQEVLQILQDEGMLFRKVKGQDEVYNVRQYATKAMCYQVYNVSQSAMKSICYEVYSVC